MLIPLEGLGFDVHVSVCLEYPVLWTGLMRNHQFQSQGLNLRRNIERFKVACHLNVSSKTLSVVDLNRMYT